VSTESGVIEAVRLERIETVKVAGDPTKYEFRVDGGAHWLQRLCFWVLGKLGAFADLHTIRVERHIVGRHGDSFMWRLVNQKLSLLREGYSPAEILVGAEDYAQLMDECSTSEQPFAFDTRYFSAEMGQKTIHGLRVRVIPWMRGILVLPREAK
jgi:hypothetical protein